MTAVAADDAMEAMHDSTFAARVSFCLLVVIAMANGADTGVTMEEDPYLALEGVTDEKALAWVREQNAVSKRVLEAQPGFAALQQRLRAILDSKDRIPFVVKRGKHFYNFWQDQQHVRGIWRRTTLEEYKKVRPSWELVLDVDLLGRTEKENWVWKGATVLERTHDRCLVALSRGGADATVIREFDLKAKRFVTNGFTLPEAKSRVDWKDRDHLYIATDFGPGSLTKSGYPRIVREWQRGTPLLEAATIFEGSVDDVSSRARTAMDHGRFYEFLVREPTFFTEEVRVRRGRSWVQIDKPADAEVHTFGDSLLLKLRSDWSVGGKRYASGSLLAVDFDKYLDGKGKFEVLFEPSEKRALETLSATRHYLLVTELDNVRGRAALLRPSRSGWIRTPLAVPEFGTVSLQGIDPEESDDYFLTVSDPITPSTLYWGVAGKQKREKLKSLPSFFDPKGIQVQQFEAVSKDGTRIPYFQVARANSPLDGSNPTLLYGYGGFNIPVLPTYNALAGAAWIERGGVFVVANIRGGGEFGPQWHEAARKEHRQRAYDDFIAVAEDLIARKVTSPKHLGIQGGSNGGLLMGVMLTERPDLWGAVVCQVPLLDMRRYHKLLAGASWMDEYGNPDTADWDYIQKYSPYQNVKKGVVYPPILFMTSTRDDRVHPGHARKMVARMKEQGHDVLYYENIEGGHGGAANNEQVSYMRALAYAFLMKELN